MKPSHFSWRLPHTISILSLLVPVAWKRMMPADSLSQLWANFWLLMCQSEYFRRVGLEWRTRTKSIAHWIPASRWRRFLLKPGCLLLDSRSDSPLCLWFFPFSILYLIIEKFINYWFLYVKLIPNGFVPAISFSIETLIISVHANHSLKITCSIISLL